MISASVYIVTPCYNAVNTISETIASILTQKGEFFLFYHIQDGGSTDGTIDILSHYDTYISSNPSLASRITFTWSSQPDKCMYDAISKGFSYFDIPEDALMTWINADDTFLDNTLERIVSFSLNCKDVDWFGGLPMVMEKSNSLSQRRVIPAYPPELLRAGACDEIHWPCIQQEGTFWRKKLWDRAGGIDRTFKLAGDWDLWRRMSFFSSYIQLPFPTAVFHRRDGQLSEGEAYTSEISAHCPLAVRRHALRTFLRRLPSYSFQSVSFLDGKWEIRDSALKIDLTSKIKLALVSLGFYRILRLLRTIKLFLTSAFSL